MTSPARNPLSAGTLFLIIVAALLTAFIGIPIGCSNADVLAFWGLSKPAEKVAENPVPAPDSATAPAVPSTIEIERPSVPPAPVQDERPMAVVLRERARWPIDVELTRDRIITIPGGEMTLTVGRKLRATMINDDGELLISVADQTVRIPFYDTNFLAAMSASESAPAPSLKPKPIPQAPRSPAAPRIDRDRRLAELKAHFPAAEKRKAAVVIRNAAPNPRMRITSNYRSHRTDVIEVDVPHPDVYSKYRGWVMVASVGSLPAVLDKLEAQLSSDLADLHRQMGLSQAANAQAQHSYDWLNGRMRPYLSQLRAVANAR